MSYGRLNKPRFYMDIPNWQFSKGRSRDSTIALNTGGTTVALAAGSTKYQLFDMDPLNKATFSTGTGTGTVSIKIDLGLNNLDPDFVCIMNHNLKTADGKIRVASAESAIAEAGGADVTMTEVFNADITGNIAFPDNDGDSLFTFVKTGHRYYVVEFYDVDTWDANLTVGEIVLGEYYTMPSSPDGLVTKGTAFEGVQKRRSYGGKTFATAGYIAPSTETYTPFRYGSGSIGRQMAGRETVAFDMPLVADTNVYPSDRGTIVTNTENSFLFDVVNKSAMDLLPFIFCYDSTSVLLGDYMYARFDQNIFESVRQAYQLESYNLKIVQEF